MTDTTQESLVDAVQAARSELTDREAAHAAAIERASDLRSKLETLRESVRSGARVQRSAITDAQGDADHADLEAEAADRLLIAARDHLREAQIAEAISRLPDAHTRQEIAEAQAAVRDWVARLERLTVAYNANQVRVFGELRDLDVPGFNGPIARAHQLDLTRQLAGVLMAAFGRDIRKLTGASQNLRNAITGAVQ